MQFSTSFLALFAATALALPGSPVQERQAIPTAYVRFWNPPTGGNTCQPPLADDIVFTEDQTTCVRVGITNPYKALNVTGNELTRTLRLFEFEDCPTAGTHFDVLPQTDYNCFVQTVRSAIIL